MKTIVKNVVSTAMYFGGMCWVWMKVTGGGRNIPIVFYHEVGNTAEGDSVEFSVNARNFENQIKWLKNHYNVVSINTLVKHINGRLNLRGNPAAVAFDGGYKGNYQYAFPILKKYQVPATIYVTTNSVDGNIPWERELLYLFSLTKKNQFNLFLSNREYHFEMKIFPQKRSIKKLIEEHMKRLNEDEQQELLMEISYKLEVDISGLAHQLFLSWDQILEMNRNPLIDIGSHTLTHPRLTEVPLVEAKREIFESKSHIENKLGEKITSFCYPDGYFSKEIIHLVKNAGYTFSLGVSVRGILNNQNKIGDDVFKLVRISMPNSSYIPLIASEIPGIMKVIKKAGRYFII